LLLSSQQKAVKLTVNKIMESDMKRILVAVIALGAMFSNAAFASEQLAREKNCLACHAVDNKLVGPGYKEVAAKYKGDKSAEDKLAQKIMKGGSGVWGQIPMPANPQVSAAEAKTLAKWVLSMK
jgi:cytochrome c